MLEIGFAKNTNYSITVEIVSLYGCSSFKGFYKGELLYSRNGNEIAKNVNKVLYKLKEHEEKNKE